MRQPLIVTLTLNPAVDLSGETERVVPEHKLRCKNERHDPGGGGINVARVLRRLGADPLAVFFVDGADQPAGAFCPGGTCTAGACCTGCVYLGTCYAGTSRGRCGVGGDPCEVCTPGFCIGGVCDGSCDPVCQ